MSLFVDLAKAVEALKENKNKDVTIVSHYDADGITSASILMKALSREGIAFKTKIVKHLRKETVEEIYDNDRVFIFSDIGSGQLKLLKPLIEENVVIILDHHHPVEFMHRNLYHVNPMLYGRADASGSVVSYLFAKMLNDANKDLVSLAIVGAVGDAIDEKWELRGLSRKVVEEAVANGYVEIVKGLRLYGRSTRPIHKALELSMDPYIPGISGSESNAVQFLSELGIKVKQNGKWRYLKDLSLEEQRKLATAIILERLKNGHVHAEDIFGEIYLINGNQDELSDAREFATLINACSRLGRHDVALKLCLTGSKALREARRLMKEYRAKIADYVSWVETNKENPDVVMKGKAHFIFGMGKIMDTMIGTVTSIVLSSNLLGNERPVLGFADINEKEIKVSARVAREVNLNMRDILIQASQAVGGEAGGHEKAAGAIVPADNLKNFVEEVNLAIGEKLGRGKR